MGSEGRVIGVKKRVSEYMAKVDAGLGLIVGLGRVLNGPSIASYSIRTPTKGPRF